MAEKIKKVHSGFQIDGIDLLRGNCGCGGLTGPGGSGVGDCYMTYSTTKHEGNKVSFFAKGTTPNRRITMSGDTASKKAIWKSMS